MSFPLIPVGKSLAVEALVHVIHGVHRLDRKAHGLEKPRGDAMRLLSRDFVPVVLAAVERRQMVGPDLAQIVDERRRDQDGGRRGVEPHLLGHSSNESGDLSRVSLQIGA